MKTDAKKSIEVRLSEIYIKSGMSTITSLTNIGSSAASYVFFTLPIMKYFFIFMACCLIFDYIYQITFVGAFVANIESVEPRLHSVIFLPHKDASSSGK